MIRNLLPKSEDYYDLHGWNNWLSDVLALIFLIIVPLGFLFTFPVLIARHNYFLVTLDLMLWVLLFIRTFIPGIALYLRHIIWMSVIYVMAISFFAALGPNYARPAWLMLCAVMAAVIYGVRGAVISSALNFIILFALFFLYDAKSAEWSLAHRDGPGNWLMFMVNLTLLSLCASVSVGLLFSRLDRSLRVERQAKEELQESEKRYRLIAENTADLISILDMNLQFTYVSPASVRLRGFTVEEAMKQTIDQVLTPESLQLSMAVFEKEMELEAAGTADPDRMRILELEEYKKDSSIIWVEVSLSFLRDKDLQPIEILMVSRDITERKQAQEKFRLITEHMLDCVALVDITGTYQYVSPSHRDTLGYDPEEMIGRTGFDFIHPDDLERVTLLYAEGLEQRLPDVSFETMIRHKDGHYIPMEIRVREIKDAQGKQKGGVLTARDITKRIQLEQERKQAEEEKHNLEERLQRAEKMEALGKLAGGVAHDLNNVLGILSGYSELLLMEVPEGHQFRDHAEKILQSTEKGAAIIQDLLTLARRGVTAADVINLNAIVADFLQAPMLEKMKEYHPGVTFKTELDENLLNIRGSSVHLEKTLMNLVSNAAEAISEKGEVTIRTESRYLDRAIRGYDEIKEGDYAVLIVTDTGMGIPAENKDKIFEPFYTKKTMGRSGTGLGLSIVWGTVKDHNGYIYVQTEVGVGTTFALYFPTTREEQVTGEQKMPVEQYRGRGESVLVVDDIADQRDIATRLLTRLGYEVHSVASGEEAVEYLRVNRADILVLDMIMAPGIDGLTTYQRVLEINPQQKAILVSGFSETDRVRKAQKLGAGPYIKKPYVIEKIGLALRSELDKK